VAAGLTAWTPGNKLQSGYLITLSMKLDRNDRRPSIVFILADDLGWSDTSLYGSTYFGTPHIEALAARGTMFTQAGCASNPRASPDS
jgi:hypothetical protein